MPIMKLPAPNGKTIWILHPHRVFDIIDNKDKKSCTMYFTPHLETAPDNIVVDGFTARQLKRSIQENVDTPINFLKSVYYAKHQGNIVPLITYINTDYLVYLTETEIDKGHNNTVPGTELHFESITHKYILEHDHTHIALQLRRIAERLDQDEELCCTTHPSAEEE